MRKIRLEKSKSKVWSWRQGSNLRPAVYKTAALPTELRQRQENHESYHTKGYSAGLGG